MIPAPWAVAGFVAAYLLGFLMCAAFRIQELDERSYPRVER